MLRKLTVLTNSAQDLSLSVLTYTIKLPISDGKYGRLWHNGPLTGMDVKEQYRPLLTMLSLRGISYLVKTKMLSRSSTKAEVKKLSSMIVNVKHLCLGTGFIYRDLTIQPPTITEQQCSIVCSVQKFITAVNYYTQQRTFRLRDRVATQPMHRSENNFKANNYIPGHLSLIHI